MGDPKKSRRQYFTPAHPWEGERIAREKEYVKKYGLKNKTELWKAQSSIRKFRSQAKDLMARTRVADHQAQIEVDLLKKKLIKVGLLISEGTLDDILALDVETVLNRRLQTIVYHKGLASSHIQARQFIAHGHICIGDTVVNTPGRIITKKEEELVEYNEFSPISHDLHPSRPKEKGAMDVVIQEEEKKEEKGEKLKLTPKAKKVLEKSKLDKDDVKDDDDDSVFDAPDEKEEETTENAKTPEEKETPTKPKEKETPTKPKEKETPTKPKEKETPTKTETPEKEEKKEEKGDA